MFGSRAHRVRAIAVLATTALAVGSFALAPGVASAAPEPGLGGAVSSPPPSSTVTLAPGFTGGVDYMVESMARQSDGKIVSWGVDKETLARSFTRVTATGAADPTFTAPVLAPGGGNLQVTAAPDDALLISGAFTHVNGVPRPGLARLTRDGALDPAFVPSTPAPLSFRGTGPVTLEPDGHVLLVGEFDGVAPTGPGIARFTSTGALDPGFTARLTGTTAVPASATIVRQPDGNLLLGGPFTKVNGVSRNGIARITATGALDPTFAPGGGFAGWWCPGGCAGPTPGYGVNSLVLQPDGRIVVGGSFTIFDWFPANQLIRLTAAGQRDPGFDAGTGVRLASTGGSVPDRAPAAGGKGTGGAGSVRPPRDAGDGSAQHWTTDAINAYDQLLITTLVGQPDGRVVIAGLFEQYRGTLRAGIARVNTDGSVDLTFDPGAGFYGGLPRDAARGGAIFALMATPDGGLLAGGSLVTFDETPVANLAPLVVGEPRPARFVPLPSPVRVFDSRSTGIPVADARSVDVTGGGIVDLPPGTSAVAVNLTATGTSSSGYATLSRDDSRNVLSWSCPGSSALNWSHPQQTISNAVITGVSGSKRVKVCLRSPNAGTAHMVLDLLGYYAVPEASEPGAGKTRTAAGSPEHPGSVLVPLTPQRAYDSRAADGPLAGGARRTVDLAATLPGVVPPAATAVAFNLTATGTTASGYLSVAPGGTAGAPGTSAVNWTGARQTIANASQVGLAGSAVEVFAGGTGSTHLTFDVVGYFVPAESVPAGSVGLEFLTISPTRAYDSRAQDGPLSGNATTGAPGAGRSTSLRLGGSVLVEARAVAANLAATGTTGSGYLTTSPLATPVPTTSSLNWTSPSTTIANASISGTSPTGNLTTWAGGRSSTHYVIDISGYFVPAP